jgi:hypothetical protein
MLPVENLSCGQDKYCLFPMATRVRCVDGIIRASVGLIKALTKRTHLLGEDFSLLIYLIPTAAHIIMNLYMTAGLTVMSISLIFSIVNGETVLELRSRHDLEGHEKLLSFLVALEVSPM